MGYILDWLFPVTNGVKIMRDSQQLIHITHSATVTTLAGAEATGDDLKIIANTTDSYPYFKLNGNASFNLVSAAGSNVSFWWGGTEGARLTYNANKTTFYGGTVTGDDLEIKPNSTDGTAILLNGNGAIEFYCSTINFGTYGAITTETLQGYITVKDIAGNDRKLGVVA